MATNRDHPKMPHATRTVPSLHGAQHVGLVLDLSPQTWQWHTDSVNEFLN